MVYKLLTPPNVKIFKSRAACILLLLSTLFLTSYCPADKYFARQQMQQVAEPQSRFFLITVIDSDDEIIGERCKTDQEEVTDYFKDLSDWLGISSISIKNIDGNQFSKAVVNDAIANWLVSMQPGKKDIIVFYYSGHGFRQAGDKSTYPRMWLKTATDRDVDRNNLRLEEDIYDPIVKLGAGVNIILSDCCNSVPGANMAFSGSLKKRESKKPSTDEMDGDIADYEKLFSPNVPISIIATASDATELAGGTADVGGFFTMYFLEALDGSIYDDDLDANWNTILNYAKEEAAKKALGALCPENKHNPSGRCIQTAKFRIAEGEEN